MGFGFVSLFSLTIANGHVQNSDDTIGIESDDIQLRWLDKSTMQIIWSGKEGMEDGSINEDSSDNGLFSQSSTKSPGESDDNSETASSDTTSQPSNMENDMDTNEDGSGIADLEESLKTILWLEPLLLDVKQRNFPLLILILAEDSTFRISTTRMEEHGRKFEIPVWIRL